MTFYFKTRKGVLYQEVVIIAFSLLLTGLFLYLSVSAATNFTGEIEDVLNPDLKSEFESVYIYTFLKQELDSKDKGLFFNDESGNYEVKDLIWLNNDESVERLKQYKKDYLSKTENSIQSYYDTLEDKSFFDKANLLYIFSVNNCIVNLKSYTDRSSLYYIKSKDNKDILISFENPTLKTKDNEGIKCGAVSALLSLKFIA